MDISALRCCDVTRQERESVKLQSILKDFTIDDLLYPSTGGGSKFASNEDNCLSYKNSTETHFELGCAAQSMKMRLTKYGQIFVDN